MPNIVGNKVARNHKDMGLEQELTTYIQIQKHEGKEESNWE